MGWVKLDDQFSRHPKVLRAGPLAGWLHVCALNYCAQYLTDGFIPRAAVNALADFSGMKAELALCSDFAAVDFVPALVENDMWAEVEGGYLIHDYLDYNPSRDDVLKRRRTDVERKRTDQGIPEDSGRNPNGMGMDSNAPVPGPRPVPVRKQDDDPPKPPTGAPPTKNGAAGYLSAKPPSKSAAVIDAFRALHIEPILSARDHAAIKQANAPPELIAEVYDAVARCEYGDDFMRRRLSVHEAIEWINGYVEHKAEVAWQRGEQTA